MDGPINEEVGISPATLMREVSELFDQRKVKEAEEKARKALKLAPNDPSIWNDLGVIVRADERLDEALDCYRKALALASSHAGAWSNLGNLLKDMKQVDSGIACHERAIALQPDSAHFLHNLSVSLTAAHRHQEAIDTQNRALLMKPMDPKIRWDRALSYLQIGNLSQGWVDYEARFETGDLPSRKVPGERWTGQRYAGKRLVIISEQGFGDTIWVARYLRQVKALGGELVLECRPELIPLIASMGIVDQFIPKGKKLPEAEWHCYLCSVPGLFTSNIDSIPGEPYIAAPADRIAKIAPVLNKAGSKLRVGIVWSGSTTFKANHNRAAKLERFLRAFAVPGVQLFSLQKGPPEAELQEISDAPIIDLSPHLRDFADTAAAISQLDLIIMTDSAVAHLAGAMGKPVWVLLHHVAFWLWLTERSDSPWYPSVRLFRPKAWDDWNSVFDSAAAELFRLSAGRLTMTESRRTSAVAAKRSIAGPQASTNGTRRPGPPPNPENDRQPNPS